VGARQRKGGGGSDQEGMQGMEEDASSRSTDDEDKDDDKGDAPSDSALREAEAAEARRVQLLLLYAIKALAVLSGWHVPCRPVWVFGPGGGGCEVGEAVGAGCAGASALVEGGDGGDGGRRGVPQGVGEYLKLLVPPSFGPEMLERRLDVYWEAERQWFRGTVAAYKPAGACGHAGPEGSPVRQDRVQVRYDDSDKRWSSPLPTHTYTHIHTPDTLVYMAA